MGWRLSLSGSAWSQVVWLEQHIAFDALPFREEIRDGLSQMGFEFLTPVQCEVIPVALEGHDVLATAQTGTGKTAAYGLPILQNDGRGLVLCPTRELAMQVARDMRAMCANSEEIVCLIGGAPMGPQIKALKRSPEASVVATPGRLCDHMERGNIRLEDIRMFVLDEADEMLSMGFADDLEYIARAMPEGRQSMLLAATMPRSVERLASQTLHEPIRIDAGGTQNQTASTVEQSVLICPRHKRGVAVKRLIMRHSPAATIVFCKTRKRTEELAEHLQPEGRALHGGMQQNQRDRVMRAFREGKCNLLIATDVAARGLDVDRLELVLQDDFPQDEETYVHRVGRTGRAGRAGRSILMINSKSKKKLRNLRDVAGILGREDMPTDEEIEEMRAAQLIDGLPEMEVSHAALSAYESALDLGMEPHQVAIALLQRAIDAEGKAAEDGGRGAGSKARASGSVGLALGVGRNDGARPKDLVGALCNAGHMNGADIGCIDMLDKMSVVEIPARMSRQVVDALADVKIRGRWLRPRIADDWDFRDKR